MDRREFLDLGGAGLAGMVLLGTVGSQNVLAQEGSSLVEEFEEAAEKYRIPKELLLAIGNINTRWEMPPSEVSEYEQGELDGKGTYGIMALVRNPSADTLGEASKLTGISTEKLKTGGGRTSSVVRRCSPGPRERGLLLWALTWARLPAKEATARCSRRWPA